MPASVLFIEYPRCSTCKKAKKWLDEHGVSHTDRDIVEDNPTAEELAGWQARSGLPLRRFFNTSGMKYRELGIKAKLDAGMSDADAFSLLATDGMLVKRPLVIVDGGARVLAGFRENAWEDALLSVDDVQADADIAAPGGVPVSDVVPAPIATPAGSPEA